MRIVLRYAVKSILTEDYQTFDEVVNRFNAKFNSNKAMSLAAVEEIVERELECLAEDEELVEKEMIKDNDWVRIYKRV